MRKEVISSKQLVSLIVLFELGTALVVPVGLESGHAVWLSILLALPGGVVLYLIYAHLYRQFPNLILSGLMQKILGKWIGWTISLLYVPFFMFSGSRNLAEAGYLLLAASYDKTPILIINAIMIVAVVYVLSKGIEVFARTAEIYFLVIVVIGVISNSIIIASGLMDFQNLFPLNIKDLKEALASAYPNIWMFPFGELMLVTTILPFLGKGQSARNSGLAALILSALLLSFTHAIEMSVLGEEIYQRTNFPLFTTISLVNVADFIQRLDAFVILDLIICIFFKVTVYCYAAMVVAADLFKVKEPRKLAVPVGVVMLLISLISTESYTRHLEEGRVVQQYILTTVCAVIPSILFVTHWIRKRFGLYRLK
ncbi:GerAB/ArcD/ProY family transporter [Paenibacillus sp. 7124]|uniref:GerAB/ArcD/ProY family transporter n=2 Tax=Paenibacillus TaxID=44249 RepID=A0A6M1PIC8_9BACL|nr:MULTISPECIES: GerAB/ArcD/ProY family transporter [Paenibacillus]AHV98310.1 GerVB protein [Paenibacillus sabinae T27]NGM81703.1 GerAB/ArcD/ProY family transporter [Paenibacillus apii]